MISELLKLGLSPEEARVYLACLEINGGPVSVIARKADVHRVSCYHTIGNLLRKRLLSEYNRNGVKCFAAEDPEKLELFMLEKVQLARTLVPQLKSLVSSYGFKPKIRFYEGRDGVERVFRESLQASSRNNARIPAAPQRMSQSAGRKRGHGIASFGRPVSEILGYTNLRNIIDYFPDFFRDYTRKRLKLGIKSRYLSPTTVESVHVIAPFLPAGYDPNLIEILLVNKDQFPFENEVLIFGDTVGIVSLNPDELLGVVLESPTIARTMRAVFDLAWLGATAFVAK